MYIKNIKELTKENSNFRTVLNTGIYSQIVVMSIPIGEEIGEEIHPSTDQLLFIVEGEGMVILNGEEKLVKEHDVIFIPAGILHNLKNIDDEDLKLFTIYAPPEHPEGTVHSTKEEAQLDESKKE